MVFKPKVWCYQWVNSFFLQVHTDHHHIMTSEILPCGRSEVPLFLTKTFLRDSFCCRGIMWLDEEERREGDKTINNTWNKIELENEITIRRNGCHAWGMNRTCYQAGEDTRSPFELSQWTVVKNRWENALSSVSGTEHITSESSYYQD